jgi:hypothetical protein
VIFLDGSTDGMEKTMKNMMGLQQVNPAEASKNKK